jgi:hypothetical protein
MKLPTSTRVSLVVVATALLIALALTGALPARHLMVVVGITLASKAAVWLVARAVKVRGQREAVPSLLWALAMLALVGALS